MKYALLVLFLLAGCRPARLGTQSNVGVDFLYSDAPGFVFSGPGQSGATIVIPEDASLVQRQVVADLQSYLGKMTGADFHVVHSLSSNHVGSVIYAGQLSPELARLFHVDENRIPVPGGWVIVAEKDRLLLSGLDNKGVVQAIYRLLEDYLGVHWWTPWEEQVPHAPVLRMPAVVDVGQPDFPLGHDSGAYAKTYFSTWAMRNRMVFSHVYEGDECHFVGLNYGRPFTCHSLEIVVPQDLRGQHPDWVALHNGKRDPKNRGLCLTNSDLQAFVTRQMDDIISGCMAWRDRAKIDRAGFFYLGADDGAKWCECERCEKHRGRSHSHAAPLLDLVNRVAAALEKKYPKVVFATLAYQKTRSAPAELGARRNVMIVWCPEQQNLGRPLTDEVNQNARREFEGWNGKAERKGVFYYGTTFGYGEGLGGGYGAGFPDNALRAMHRDLRYYRDHGVSYFHIDSRPDIYRHMPDLTLWMRGRLLLDVHRDFEAEIQTFTDGYYGAAGPFVREYLDELDDVTSRNPGNVWFYAELPDFDYLNLEFLTAADALWSQAAQAVRDDPLLSERVATGRMAVDRAILALWPELVRQWLRESPAHQADRLPLDRTMVCLRYANSVERESKKHLSAYDEGWRRRCYSKKDKDLHALTNNVYIAASPPELPLDAPPAIFYDYPAGGINYSLAKGIVRMPDAEADSGQVYRIPQSLAIEQEALEFDPNRGHVAEEAGTRFEHVWKFPLEWAVQPKFSGPVAANPRTVSEQELSKKGTGFQWVKLGRIELEGNHHVRLFRSSAIKIFFRQRGTFDLWIRLKYAKNQLDLDRTVLIPPNSDTP